MVVFSFNLLMNIEMLNLSKYKAALSVFLFPFMTSYRLSNLYFGLYCISRWAQNWEQLAALGISLSCLSQVIHAPLTTRPNRGWNEKSERGIETEAEGGRVSNILSPATGNY